MIRVSNIVALVSAIIWYDSTSMRFTLCDTLEHEDGFTVRELMGRALIARTYWNYSVPHIRNTLRETTTKDSMRKVQWDL